MKPNSLHHRKAFCKISKISIPHEKSFITSDEAAPDNSSFTPSP